MAEPHGHQKKDLLPASSAAHQEAHQKVYSRCIERHLRVLDAKIASLEIRLNDELLKKSSSSSRLQAGMVINNILDEMERTRAKRDALYAANQEKINKGNGNGNGDAPPPSPSAGM